MGGLAIRFAADGDTVPTPIPASAIGGVVTFDTPHEGSPFGGSLAAQVTQWSIGAFKRNLPDENSDAAKCLARHDGDHPLPAGCATPTYLPAGTRLTEI